VFGPHVRAFDVDGSGTATPNSKVSFLAYGTYKWGVNVAAGDIDSDGIDEIITGAGPGEIFGANVRSFDFDGTAVTPMEGVNFIPFGYLYGVQVGSADMNGDGPDDLVLAPGPDERAPALIQFYRLNDSDEVELFGSIVAFDQTRYGGHVAGGRFYNVGSAGN